MIRLTLKRPPAVPLEAEVLSPSLLAGLSHTEICGLHLYHGKRRMRVDEFFDVEGERSSTVDITGDLRRVRWLGRGMTDGTLTIHGSAGMHLGARMKGGRIEVFGNADDWVGAEMTNGLVRIHGHAGGQIGGAYRGSLRGMKNGTIIVEGTAGLEVGLRMRRGTIVIGGRVRDFCGLQMKGGTIILLDGAEIRTGAWMNRGTILSLRSLKLLPTFRFACYDNPTFIGVHARFLKPLGIRLPHAPTEGSWARYCGDFCVPGKGEIFIWHPAAAPEPAVSEL